MCSPDTESLQKSIFIHQLPHHCVLQEVQHATVFASEANCDVSVLCQKHTRRLSDEDRSEEQYPVCETVIQHQQNICPKTEDKPHPDKTKLTFICKSTSSIETKVIPS